MVDVRTWRGAWSLLMLACSRAATSCLRDQVAAMLSECAGGCCPQLPGEGRLDASLINSMHLVVHDAWDPGATNTPCARDTLTLGPCRKLAHRRGRYGHRRSMPTHFEVPCACCLSHACVWVPMTVPGIHPVRVRYGVWASATFRPHQMV